MSLKTIDQRINTRNKSVISSIKNRASGRWSFQNSTNWINYMKVQLRELHFERLVLKQKN